MQPTSKRAEILALVEQRHSEIKSDVGLVRFPSGYFNTNGAVLKLAMLVYNILRTIGQTALMQTKKRIRRHPVFRLRAKTVMSKLVYIAGQVTTHARKWRLDLGRSNAWRDVLQEVYAAFA